MLPTRLILIEGPPGSGKSTAACRLAEKIRRAGYPCACHLEWDADHPIPIGSDLALGQVIATARSREAEMLARWRRLARERQDGQEVTVLESRFWQTSLMLMYAAGHPLEGLFAAQRRVVDALRPLEPVMILFAVADLRAFTARTIQVKEAEWQAGGLPGTWAGHVYAALDGQPWLTARGLRGQEGFLAFLEEWAGVSQQLYRRLPFEKITVADPHLDRERSARQVDAFLHL